MKGVTLQYEGISLVDKETILSEGGRLQEYRKILAEVLSNRDYEKDEASLLLPDADLGVIDAALDSYKSDSIKYVVVVGIGGSSLGTEGLYRALLGDSYTTGPGAPKMLFLDTIDSRHTANILAQIEHNVKDKDEIVINLISKSGGTTETIVNFEVLFRELSEHIGDITSRTIVTTGEGSELWEQAHKKGMLVLPIPKKVGGRYSVFSAVGLFPLGLCGVNIKELLSGAKDARDMCLIDKVEDNPAMIRAALHYIKSLEGMSIHNSFFFNPELEYVGKWYRQLMGEGIGKEKDNNGKVVRNGITPLVSIGSTDLHSVAQLYLGGPRDKMTTFIYAKTFNEGLRVPDNKVFNLLPRLEGKGLTDVMNAI